MPRSLERCHGRLLDKMVSRQRSSESPQTSRCVLLLRMRPSLLSSPHRGFCPLITSFYRLYFSGSLSEFCAIVSDFLCVVLWRVSCPQSEAQWGVIPLTRSFGFWFQLWVGGAIFVAGGEGNID
ncbi:unnamed protein product [Malus baccata var. baccata]